MTAREAFGLIVRAFGLVPFVYGLFDSVGLVLRLFGLRANHPEITTAEVAGAAVGYIFIGIAIILCAKPIMRLAYGRE